MEKRNYTHVQVLLPAIKAMLAEGKSQREAAEYYGFYDKQVVKRLLEHERRKERKLETGILPRPKGRSRKNAAPRNIVAEQVTTPWQKISSPSSKRSAFTATNRLLSWKPTRGLTDISTFTTMSASS